MAKLDKTQRDYVLKRLATETNKAINEYAATRPVAFTKEEVREKLESKGFLVQDRGYFYVTLPPSAKMVANAEAIEAFKNKAYAAQQEAQDKIYLSDADGALEILEQFTAALSKL